MLDGIVLQNILHDLQKLKSGRIDKIYQPSREEIVLGIRAGGKNHKLVLSANASAPRLHFTDEKLENPASPPMFCMLLRKHISGKIIDIVQPNFERILEIHIESMSELGDLSTKRLIIEIMGKHSNIILVNDKDIIIDSIKHINKLVSSVREVMPGRTYERPPSQNKLSFLELNNANFLSLERTELKELYKHYSGLSPKVSDELNYRAGIDEDTPMSDENVSRLLDEALSLKESLIGASFRPYVVINNANKLSDFHSIPLHIYSGYEIKYFEDISKTLEYFYTQRDQTYRTTQKTSDMRKIVQNNINRCIKKHEMFLRNLKEIEGKEQLRLYGELITANIHAITSGASTFTTPNFYSEDMADITIPLDNTLSPAENAQRYFKLYNKHKRSGVATLEQMEENNKELNYLESVLNSLSVELSEEEIEEIRNELVDEKILKRKNTKLKLAKTSAPFKFTSSDGFMILVGKNNKQNDDITTSAGGTDIWLHTKDIPGSHVIIKTQNQDLVPDTTLEEAAALAAFYSKASDAHLVSVDYTQKKYVRKPKGAKPGMVIYDNFKTAHVSPRRDIGKDE